MNKYMNKYVSKITAITFQKVGYLYLPLTSFFTVAESSILLTQVEYSVLLTEKSILFTETEKKEEKKEEYFVRRCRKQYFVYKVKLNILFTEDKTIFKNNNFSSSILCDCQS